LRLNQSNQVGRSLLETDIVEKSLEFLSFVQKFVINRGLIVILQAETWL
jgi:hypothetical protein